jgi:hypothetical protein
MTSELWRKRPRNSTAKVVIIIEIKKYKEEKIEKTSSLTPFNSQKDLKWQIIRIFAAKFLKTKNKLQL